MKKSIEPTKADIKKIQTVYYQYVVLLDKEGIKAKFTREEYVDLWLENDNWKQRGRFTGDKVVAVKPEAISKTELNIDDLMIIVRVERMYKKTLVRLNETGEFINPKKPRKRNTPGMYAPKLNADKTIKRPPGRPMKIDTDEEQAIKALRSNTELQKRINEAEQVKRTNYMMMNLRTKQVYKCKDMG